MAEGTVKFFNAEKGYGFIQPDGAAKGEDVFVHRTGIVGDAYDRKLDKDQRVKFETRVGKKGTEAFDVEPI